MVRGQLLTLFSGLHLLQILLLFCGTRAEMEDPSTEIICKYVYCGMGKCTKASNSTLLLPFDCECMPGWKKVENVTVNLPPCLLPNCTIEFGGGSAPPPLFSLINISDPCSYTFCGDGSCVRTDGWPGYICKCNEESANILNMPGLACIKQSLLKVNCDGLGLWPFGPPPPPPCLSDAPYSRKDGWTKADGNLARDQPVLTTLLLLATFIPWI